VDDSASNDGKVLSEVFWIISNLMFDERMTDILFIQYKIVDHMLSFLNKNFIDAKT
jgi:hypothetical protein